MRHERAVVAAGMVDERVEQPRREELRIAGFLEGMSQTLGQILA